MRQHLYKGLTMMTLMVAVTLVAFSSANAQSRRLTASVPFDFIVADKTFASGDYEVKAATAGGEAMVIRNEDNQQSIVRLTNPIVPTGKKSSSARLVFHKYGQTYFLREIWSGGDYNGRQLLETKRERSLRREMKALAQNQYERVELVAVLR